MPQKTRRIDERRRDERWETLKRRVQLLARVDGPTLRLAEGTYIARIERITDPARILDELRAEGTLSKKTLERAAVLERPLLLVTRELLATAQRDLRALGAGPALALAREHRRALVRFAESVDEAWLKQRATRVAEVSAVLAGLGPRRDPSEWFDGVIELAAVVHGYASAVRLVEARNRVTALGAERRRNVQARIEALATALETGVPPADADLVPLVERLERAEYLPGRARKKRTLDVLRKAIAWPAAPADAVAHVAAPLREASFPDAIREAGQAIVRALPAARDPKIRDRTLDMLGWFGLAFRVGDDGVPLLSTEEVDSANGKRELAAELLARRITFAQALRIIELPFKKWALARVAGWVAEGVDIDLLDAACKAGHTDALARADNPRAARAFATWATKLMPQYKRMGITFQISPELFNHLPRNEDVAILAVCLMEQTRQGKGEQPAPGSDPIAVLDATLGMFQKLPHKASGILQRLRGTSPGAGRRAFPELAAWLDDDALLDRFVHLARLAGTPVALTKQLREDFEHAEKAARERAHLEDLPTLSLRQEARLDVLRRRDRSLGAAPKGRTKRRLRERIDELLPVAYRRELDAVFKEILREAWGIVVPAMTPAWRDAVRFWLVVDDNRSLLGDLLRRASKQPGRDIKHLFPKSQAWIDRVSGKLRVARWLAPRREEIVCGQRTFVLTIEEDPLEVLRMGIPFDTCLALESGCNASSTVMNAIDANKRVLYVRTTDGKVVARKLVAITKDLGLVGYNTYVAVSGNEERAIRIAIESMCTIIAAEVGVPLLREGVPEQLHEGFWYDDGTVGWTENVDVAAYCRSLGLLSPEKTYDALVVAARRTKAMDDHDVDALVETLTRWDDGPGNVAAGLWAVELLGLPEALRRARECEALVPAVLRTLAQRGERSMVEALGVATRMQPATVASALPDLLAAFPRSARLAQALADMTVRAMRVLPHHDDHGIGHVALNELPQLLDGVAASFDVLDTVAPAWDAFVTLVPGCASCRKRAWGDCIDEVRWLHRWQPDPLAVVKCLMSAHRSELAQRAALAIAGETTLPGGRRALERLAALRPTLGSGAAMLAARLQQEGIDHVTDAVAKNVPPLEDPSAVRSLGPRLFSIRGIHRLLPDDDAWANRDLEAWQPSPWELAYLRRRPAKRLREQLRSIAARRSGASAALEKLAWLGDVEAVEEHSARVHAKEIVEREPTPAGPKELKTTIDCVRVAIMVREQARCADRSTMPRAVESMLFMDRRLVEVAFDIVREGRGREGTDDDAKRVYDTALDVVAKHRHPHSGWPHLFTALVQRRDAEALRKILNEKCPWAFSPEEMVDLWQVEGARSAIVEELMQGVSSDWAPRITAIERAAARRGLSVDGLFEAFAVHLLEKGPASTACETESLEQLRTVIRLATTEVSPDRAAALYEQLPDELSTSVFLAAVKRLPRDRAAAIRAAGEKLKLHGDRGAARREWLKGTRTLKKKPGPSIERE